MWNRLGIVVAGASLALCLIPASPAAAAMQIGSNCAGANDGGSDTTAVSLARIGSLTQPAPMSAGGVITSWSSNSALGKTVVDRLRVLRPAGLKTFTSVAESAYQSIAPGQNGFPARIPIQPNDRLGLYAAADGGGVIYCGTGEPEDRLGFLTGDLSLETTAEFSEISNAVLAVSATVEPDRDGDGYGDETQDKCPQSAAYQSECPRVALKIFPVLGKDFLTLLVTTNLPTSVTATEALGKHGGKKGATDREPALPGDISRLRFQYTRRFRAKLAALSPRKSLIVRFTVSAPNMVGAPTIEKVVLKVDGQKKLHHKR